MDTEYITVTFIKSNGEEIELEAPVGISLLDLAHQNKDKFYLEGACEGSLACSTCHVIVDEAWWDKLGIDITDEEDDMLDFAFDITETSRLGCQIQLSEELDGLIVRLPAVNRNIQFEKND